MRLGDGERLIQYLLTPWQITDSREKVIAMQGSTSDLTTFALTGMPCTRLILGHLFHYN